MSFTTPALPIPQKFVYKTVGDLEIEADIYLPSADFKNSHCPVFLHIHGGGWISGSRKEINVPMLHELLRRGIIVTSIDYCLLPEVTIKEQFDDIRSAELWVHEDLPKEVKNFGFSTFPGKVLVGGGSAGAHLAMMVPHLWEIQPLAIFAWYGPTDFTTLTPVEKTVKALGNLPLLSPEIAKAALFDSPRTSTIPKQAEFLTSPRSLLGLELFRSGGLGEFIAGGFTSGFKLRTPGSMPESEIAAISPALLPLKGYPPLFHIVGTADQIFDATQATAFANKLNAAEVLCETLIVADGQHGFDMAGLVDGDTHQKIVKPAIDFICQFLDGSTKACSRGIVHIDLPSDAFTLPAGVLG